jgi:hypothetical protein
VMHQEAFIDVAFTAFRALKPTSMYILVRQAPLLLFERAATLVAQKHVVSFYDSKALHRALQIVGLVYCGFCFGLRTGFFADGRRLGWEISIADYRDHGTGEQQRGL